MPSGRTIYKRLMRSRHRMFWGDRAFVTVSLPANLLPPMPPFPVPEGDGWEELTDETYYRDTQQTDGVLAEVWALGHPTGSLDPRQELDGVEDRHVNEDKTTGWYDWWSGELHTTFTPSNGEAPVMGVVALSASVVDQYKAYIEWQERWLLGLKGSTGVPALDAFLAASNWARTTYPWIEDGRLYITYSVKWRYPRRRRVVCQDLARAFRTASAAGVKAKLHKAL